MVYTLAFVPPKEKLLCCRVVSSTLHFCDTFPLSRKKRSTRTRQPVLAVLVVALFVPAVLVAALFVPALLVVASFVPVLLVPALLVPVLLVLVLALFPLPALVFLRLLAFVVLPVLLSIAHVQAFAVLGALVGAQLVFGCNYTYHIQRHQERVKSK